MNRLRDLALNLATGVVALCVVVLNVVTIHQRYLATPAGFQERLPPVMLEDWRTLAAVGHRFGPRDADVTVVVFSDFECPMCRTFATETYPRFAAGFAGTTALVYRHWPLSKHRLAYPAAKASECAASQGRFREFHDLIYREQNSLGLRTFRQFAMDAGVRELDAFDECYASVEEVAAIQRDIEAVRQIGGTGTPTVVVNGWLLRGGVGPELLDSIARTSNITGMEMPRK